MSTSPRLLRLTAIVTMILTPTGTAFADTMLEPLTLHIVGRAHADAPWTDRPTEARHEDEPELGLIVVAREQRGRRSRRVYVVDDALGEVRLRGRRIRASEMRTWQQLGDVAVQWSVVEPHAWREPDAVAPNGVEARYHSNVSVSPETFGTWLGYDRITYFETVVAPWSHLAEARRHPASARPPRPREDRYQGLGTMRYRAELRLPDGRVLRTPGAEVVDRAGILPSVHRVSIRAGDDFLGYLTSYFLVPEVFGSAGAGAGHQTERYVGADCADVLTGALRRAGHRQVWHTNVASLTRYARPFTGVRVLDERGTPDQPVTGVRPGDVIRIDYGGAFAPDTSRAWDHVAVLYRDRSDPDGPQRGGPDGALDGFDLVIHMGHPRLVVEPLASQAPAKIDVLRWDPRRLRTR